METRGSGVGFGDHRFSLDTSWAFPPDETQPRPTGGGAPGAALSHRQCRVPMATVLTMYLRANWHLHTCFAPIPRMVRRVYTVYPRALGSCGGYWVADTGWW